MQEKLTFLFYTIGTFEKEHVSNSIWHSTPSDLSQRKMLRAAAVAQGGDQNPQMADIIWMLNKIDNEFGHRRNEAMHAAYELVTDTGGERETHFVPDKWSSNPKSHAFEGKGLIAEFEWLAKSTSQLAEYAYRMALHLTSDDASPEELYDEDGNENYPWPEKPSLPQKPDRTSR